MEKRKKGFDEVNKFVRLYENDLQQPQKQGLSFKINLINEII